MCLQEKLNVIKNDNYTVVFLGADEERTEKLSSVLQIMTLKRLLPSRMQSLSADRCKFYKVSCKQVLNCLIKNCSYHRGRAFQETCEEASRSKSYPMRNELKVIQSLKVGDYVVHVNHGIGKYLGIETLEINGIHKDYLTYSISRK